jgi:outer membrane autotransporter protein
MSQSINNVCPTISGSTFVAPGQMDLATICKAMTFNSLQVQNQSNPLNFSTSFGLNASQLSGAVQQLNGGAELLVPVSQTSVLQSTQTSRQTGVVEARLSRERDWMVATAAPGEFPRTWQVAALNPPAPGQILLEQNQAPSLAYSIGPLGVFATGLGQFGTKDPTTTVNGYSFNNAGFVVGADYRFNPQLIAGLAFGYTRSSTNFDTSSLSASGQSLQDNLLEGNLYASYSVTDALYLTGIAVVGGSNNNSQRHIAFGTNGFDAATGITTMAIDRTATGTFGSRVAGVTLAGGYAMPFGPVVVTPIARFLYQHTGVDALNENGALGADLAYGSSSVNTVQSFLGADAQYAMSTPFGPLYPIARFHWAHQYSPGNTSVSVAYSNDASLLSSFILPGTPTSRNYFDLGVGLGLQLSRNSSAFINYDSILGISNITYNSFTAGVRFTF